MKVTEADIEALHAGRRAGFSQAELADLFEVSPPYVSRLLRGTRRASISSRQGIEMVRDKARARKRRARAACDLRTQGKTCKVIAAEIGIDPSTVSTYLFEENPQLLYLSSQDLQMLRNDNSGDDVLVILDRGRARRRLNAFRRWEEWHQRYWREYRQRPEVRQRALEYRERPEVKQRLREYRNRPEVKQRQSHRAQRAIGGARNRRNSKTVALDAQLFDDSDATRHDFVAGGVDPFDLLTGHEKGLVEILGDMTEDEVDGLNETELLQIRDQLTASGFVPTVMNDTEG